MRVGDFKEACDLLGLEWIAARKAELSQLEIRPIKWSVGLVLVVATGGAGLTAFIMSVFSNPKWLCQSSKIVAKHTVHLFCARDISNMRATCVKCNAESLIYIEAKIVEPPLVCQACGETWCRRRTQTVLSNVIQDMRNLRFDEDSPTGISCEVVEPAADAV